MQVLDSLIDGPIRLRSRREGDELIGMIVRYLRTGERPEPRTDAQEALIAAVMPVMEESRARSEKASRAASARWGGDASRDAQTDARADAKQDARADAQPDARADARADAGRGAKAHAEEEEEEEVGIKERGEGKRARFRAPDPTEVAEYADGYAESKGVRLASTGFDAERFCDFYASKGWRVGRSPMRDWKAAVRGWIARDRREGGAGDDPRFAAYA